jgi:hypothetical protein
MDVTNEQLAKLSEKEADYFHLMNALSGVLYIKGKPGVAKSAIARSIATKLGMQYFDIRLSMVDETDIGLFPTLADFQVEVVNADGKTVMKTEKVLEFAIPKWARLANQQPTLIHFEELNRASAPVRNAALQLLLERAIGIEFKFNDNVLMIASGNLGEEDSTDVEEFDGALKNRLIHVKHELYPSEWIDGYARANVLPLIVQYIEQYPEQLYQPLTDDGDAYATPRSWTFLSDHIKKRLTTEKVALDNTERIRQIVSKVGHTMIGSSQMKFVRYLEERLQLSINDVLNNYDKVLHKIEASNRDKKSELVASLREMDVKKLSKKQVENLIKFTFLLQEDERVAYLTDIIDNVMDDELKDFPFNYILKSHTDLLEKIGTMSS